MKNILGLDLGTNSIGWAVVTMDENNQTNPRIKLGSRIIPMSQDVLGKFDSGVTESQTAMRTSYRSARRLRERYLLRRERLHRILHILKFLPEHYEKSIGWDRNDNKTYGKFLDDSEPKIAWEKCDDGKMRFCFMKSFEEMVADFRSHGQTTNNIPMDWTLYYLRHKAITSQITKTELAWILLNFNKKRGYYQLRGEDEDNDTNKKEEYYELRVDKVEATDDKKGTAIWYNIILENGWIYRRASNVPLNEWEGKKMDFVVTTELDAEGNVKLSKDGTPKRSFRSPKEEDWKLQKKKAEHSIEASGSTVGSYIYTNLRNNPSERVRGKLVKTIERDFYMAELRMILSKQKEFIPELHDYNLFKECINELYNCNEAHRNSLQKKDLTYLIVDDLLFYQRPLKSKKSLIANCPYEQYEFVDKETGEIKIQHIKCAAKSNPYFQEFRLWQFIQNLRFVSSDTLTETDVTKELLPTEEDYVRLFLYLNDRKEICQDVLLKDFFGMKKAKGKDLKYPIRWNYVEDKAYPCNETRYIFLSALRKAEVREDLINDRQMVYRLWHLLYSVDDKKELVRALRSFADQKQLPDSFVESFKKIPSFKKEYAAYSEKAIKKLLTVMRMGSLWREKDASENVNILNVSTFDSKIKVRMANGKYNLQNVADFKGLPVWLACYAVYGNHSEVKNDLRWEKPSDLLNFISSFKQYSLRNPIVEQCILETLRTVHDIWVEVGSIDEIHVELGRSMKSTSDQRKRMTANNTENENTNMRIRQLLIELKEDKNIEDVRPYSPMQQEILRIYEEGALADLRKDDKDYEDIQRISHLSNPTQSELIRYKLWLEQKYLSPYTNRPISLTKLFSPAYQIEHVIPQGRFFDDSLSNKVICEAEVNQRKSNMLGYEFISKCGGEIIHTFAHGDVRVLTTDEYKRFVSEHYAKNRAKARKLMMDDIPEEFIQRQMNDSRYISKVVISLLSNVVREDGELEAASKHVIPCTGGITDRLKKDWGMNDIWNNIVSPRFERMNQLTGTDAFGHWENKEGKRVFQTTMPLELQRGFSKKRIDHRHHAMDALVIALASRNIISYLNNESARDTQRREDLRQQLCDKNRIIRKPWNTFTQDAYAALQDIVVSFKHYVRVINKASNYYEHYNAEGRKVFLPQKGSGQWAVRQSLHDQFVFAHVNLLKKKTVTIKQAVSHFDAIVNTSAKSYIEELLNKGTKLSSIEEFLINNKEKFGISVDNKMELYYYTDEIQKQAAIRRLLDDSFNEKKIDKITDTGIQKILKKYLKSKGNDPKIAFSPEGIMSMNENIQIYNNGKKHKPIIKVRVCEALGSKFPVGTKGNKQKKYVQGAPHLYLGIYENEGVRTYLTMSLVDAIERLKQGLTPVPEFDKYGAKLLFWLSPNDLVYVPTDDEKLSANIDTIDKSRIYRFISSDNSTVYFLPITVASLIKQSSEFESLNKSEKAIDVSGRGYNEEPIKSVCWKLEVDRLGNITKIIR